MASSTVRYGIGVTRELGMDMQNFGSKNVCLMTDSNLVNLLPVKTAINSLTKYKNQTTVYDNVRVEPTDQSLKDCIEFVKFKKFDGFVAVRNKHITSFFENFDFYFLEIYYKNLTRNLKKKEIKNLKHKINFFIR